MSTIELDQLHRKFGDTVAVASVSLSVPSGAFLSLLGPSGCGKTTTLNMIAGLERPDAGRVHIDGVDVTSMQPHLRGVAMVFQNYALYPHKTVFGNLAFGLRRARVPRAEIDRRIREVSTVLEIEDFLDRKVNQLSGGQQQRVSLARALVKQPKVFLFDEPLSNLDAALRTRMRNEIKRLHQTVGATSVFVTHDQEEAMMLSDYIAVLRAGEVVQFGTAEEIYERPNSTYVAGFVGKPRMNFISCELRTEGDKLRVKTSGFLVDIDRPRPDIHVGRRIAVGVRAEHLHALPENDEAAALLGEVTLVEPLGSDTFVELDTDCGTITVRLPGRSKPQVGDRLALGVTESELHFFDEESGNRVNLRSAAHDEHRRRTDE